MCRNEIVKVTQFDTVEACVDRIVSKLEKACGNELGPREIRRQILNLPGLSDRFRRRVITSGGHVLGSASVDDVNSVFMKTQDPGEQQFFQASYNIRRSAIAFYSRLWTSLGFQI